MFDDQTIELLPARTVMSSIYFKKTKYVFNTGGAGGAGGAGGSGGSGGFAVGGTAVALNLLNVNVGGFSDSVFSVVASFLGDGPARFVAEVEAVGL